MNVTIVQEPAPVVRVLQPAPSVVNVSTPVGGVPMSGPGPTPEQIQAAVDVYLSAHPPAPGESATDAQVAQAVTSYLIAHPPAPGLPGDDATPEQIASAVTDYLTANPPEGGQNATSEQIAEAVATHLAVDPPPAGAAGSAWYTGSGPPTVDARTNDMYLDVATGDVWQML